MHAPSPALAHDFGHGVLQAASRRLSHLLSATIGAGVATYLALSFVPPEFAAEARVEVAAGGASDSALSVHVRALKDPERIVAVATALGMQRRADFVTPEPAWFPLRWLQWGKVPRQGLLTADERLLEHTYRRLEILPDRDRSVIVVRLLCADPQLAAQFVNHLVANYVREASATPSPVVAKSWADTPDRPSSPRKGLGAVIGMTMMLLLGTGGIMARAALRWVRPPRSSPRARPAPSSPALFAPVASIGAAADRLLAGPAAERGVRTMVAGEAPDIDATGEGLQLAGQLSRWGRQVVLIKWSMLGGGIGGGTGGLPRAGINDLMQGQASFEDVIARLPASSVHAIAAGSPANDRAAMLDPDRLNLVFDTLDEVYEHIVVTAGHEEARALFAALEGRFDACVSVADSARAENAMAAGVERFLGYEVTEIDIMRLERGRCRLAACASRRERARGIVQDGLRRLAQLCLPGRSGRDIQLTSSPAGTTQESPAMT